MWQGRLRRWALHPVPGGSDGPSCPRPRSVLGPLLARSPTLSRHHPRHSQATIQASVSYSLCLVLRKNPPASPGPANPPPPPRAVPALCRALCSCSPNSWYMFSELVEEGHQNSGPAPAFLQRGRSSAGLGGATVTYFHTKWANLESCFRMIAICG